ncbi:DDE-type integrase/transposase/recombinase [Methanoculleus oceani]|nr:DDE-type integrase/transposase/recombinase [Methanoculleus sp. CWC-02]
MVKTTSFPSTSYGVVGFNTVQHTIPELFSYNTIYKNTDNAFAVEFRKKMVELHSAGHTQKEIADALNCSVSVVKKWLRRWREGDSLKDQSRAPLHREVKDTQFNQYLVAETLEKYPFYGSRRIAHEIEKEYGITVSHVTVSQMMKEIQPEKPKVEAQRIEIDTPDQIWHLDMMQMRIAKGYKQYIFGIVDACTRRVMAVMNYDNATSACAVDCLRLAVENNGGKVPKQLYTDNGRMFTSAVFEAFCKDMGVYHHRTKPHSPWENGKIERLFGTLRREWIAYRRYMKPESLRASLAEFRYWFNDEREIQKLGYKTPAQIFAEVSAGNKLF